MRKKLYEYSFGIMTVFFLHDVNPADVKVDCVLDTKDIVEVVNEGLTLAVNSLPGHAIPNMKHKTDEHWWRAVHLCMHLFVREDQAGIKLDGAIELSQICNTSSALEQSDSTFHDNMKVMVSFGGAFELEHRVKMLHVGTVGLVDNFLSSDIYQPGHE